MNLNQFMEIHAGGPGSGRHPRERVFQDRSMFEDAGGRSPVGAPESGFGFGEQD